VLTNRGAALFRMRRVQESLSHYAQALAVRPDHPEAHYFAGMTHLCLGEWEEGWKQFEWRWWTESFGGRGRSGGPKAWRGEEPIAGRTLLLTGEQGLGDTLHFVRYAPLVARRGARVILRVQPTLVPLLAGMHGVDRVVPTEAPTPEYDLRCPLMSLPLIFGTTLENVPADVPYLAAAPDRLERWRRRLGRKTGPRIGLVWSGNHGHRDDRNRSAPLERLLRLTSLPGREVLSLQKELRDADRAALAASGMRCFGDELEDFSDTGALVSLLDLVITVDTAVAHLAGALGRPVWILLPFAGDWRWMLDREDSPWYPTARLFRQGAPGAWEELAERVVEALDEQPGLRPAAPRSRRRRR
jgi:hypothetical protein